MKKCKTSRNKISAVFLLLLFSLPIFTQVSHVFSDHDHPICTDVTTHIHKTEKDCSICDFHFVPFSFNALAFSLESPATPASKQTSFYQQNLDSKLLLTHGQRGPPSAS
jgi:hypothetical protein